MSTASAVDEIPAFPELPRARLLRPVVVGAVLAVVCAPLGTTLPGVGLDPSWQVGLSLSAAQSMPAGRGILFAYGPLGFVGAPNLVWLPGLLLGTVYALAVAFALYTLCYSAMLRWLAPTPAVAAIALIATVAAAVRPTPEMATLACVLWALRVVDGQRLLVRLPLWVPFAFGAIASAQLLIKFSVGLFGLGLALVVALARPARVRNVAAALTGFVIALGGLWVLLGQPVSALGPWLRGAADVAGGYSSAMALAGDTNAADTTIVLVAALGVLAFGGYVLVAREHLRALPALLVLAATAWFLTKEGFVRLDAGHAAATFLGLAVLAVALPWPRRWALVGGAGAVVALVGIVVVGYAGSGSVLDTTQELARTIRSSVDTSYRDQRLASARRELRAAYDIPDDTIAALRGRRVHVDPWDVSAVWAYGLSWEPVPVFQTYAAFTPHLDALNRDRLLARPRLSILRQVDTSVDHRVPTWESPDYMVAMTCAYEVAASGRGWQALTPTRDHCARARPLGSTTVAEGAVVHVPRPRDPQSLVVATYELSSAPLARLAVMALKPLRIPSVAVDGRIFRFVDGTADGQHLLRVPPTVGSEQPTNAGLDIRTLAFTDVGGPVTVRFSELPTR